MTRLLRLCQTNRQVHMYIVATQRKKPIRISQDLHQRVAQLSDPSDDELNPKITRLIWEMANL